MTENITVHVVAWQYNEGSGFNWYRRPDDADRAYLAELASVETWADHGWSAYRFPVEVASSLSPEDVTSFIYAQLDELCQKATQKKENILDGYGRVLSDLNKEVA